MNPDKPSLAKMTKEIGPVATLSAVVEMIISVQDYFNTTVKMSPVQIEEAAEIIIERWYFLRMDELKLCFRNAKAGDYGEIYNRLDGQVIMQWLIKYDESRTAVVVKANKQLASGNIYEELQHPQIADAVKIAYDRLRVREVEQAKPKPVIPRQKTAGELWAAEITAEFDELFMERPHQRTPRTVLYNGIEMDQSMFFQTRFDELTAE